MPNPACGPSHYAHDTTSVSWIYDYIYWSVLRCQWLDLLAVEFTGNSCPITQIWVCPVENGQRFLSTERLHPAYPTLIILRTVQWIFHHGTSYRHDGSIDPGRMSRCNDRLDSISNQSRKSCRVRSLGFYTKSSIRIWLWMQTRETNGGEESKTRFTFIIANYTKE